MRSRALGYIRKIKTSWEHATAKVEQAPIVFYGNQKSGTTAISSLIAEAAGLDAQIGFPELWEPNQRKIYQGEISLEQVVHAHKANFSKKIFKEPTLSFLYPQMKETFPQSRAVWIVRHPVENLRSILNRLNIKGDLDELGDHDLKDVNPTWMTVLRNEWLGIEEKHHVKSMALRWNMAVQVYLNHKEDMILIRYEDFNKDKKGTIKKVLEQLGLTYQVDVSERLDHPFTQKGNKKLTGKEFFGEKNLNHITEICRETAQLIGYDFKKYESVKSA